MGGGGGWRRGRRQSGLGVPSSFLRNGWEQLPDQGGGPEYPHSMGGWSTLSDELWGQWWPGPLGGSCGLRSSPSTAPALRQCLCRAMELGLGLGPLNGTRLWASCIWQGLGLPCPACHLPGSNWALDLRLRVGSPQTLSGPVLCPRSGRLPGGCTQLGCFLAGHGTNPMPRMAGLTPTTVSRGSCKRRGGGHHLRGPQRAPAWPNSSTRWLGTGGLGGPPSPGLRAHWVSRASESWAALSGLREVAEAW